jgi:hypothetical protein
VYCHETKRFVAYWRGGSRTCWLRIMFREYLLNNPGNGNRMSRMVATTSENGHNVSRHM